MKVMFSWRDQFFCVEKDKIDHCKTVRFADVKTGELLPKIYFEVRYHELFNDSYLESCTFKLMDEGEFLAFLKFNEEAFNKMKE